MRPDHRAPAPPVLGRLLLRLSRLGERRDEVDADLFDLFQRRASERGLAFARRRYIADVLSLYRLRRTPEVIADPADSRGTEAMIHDVLFALRLSRRHPLLYGITVAGLAVAIAISAAVFSIVRSIAFVGDGIPAADRVYKVSLASGPFTFVTGTSATIGEWAFSDFRRLRDESRAITLVASINDNAEYRAPGEEGQGIAVAYRAVTGDYFSVLGLRTETGRMLLPTDDRPQLRNAVVSRGFWLNALGGDRQVIGRTILLNDEPFTIVGIADRRHSGPPSRRVEPSVWISTTAHAEMWSNARAADVKRIGDLLAASRNNPALTAGDRARLSAIEVSLPTAQRSWNPPVEVMGRLTSGGSKAHAEAEVTASAVGLAAEARSRRTPVVTFDPPGVSQRETMTIAAVLMAVVALVVLLACANVTNVLLASAAGRRREIGTRLAIGASRTRILRQLLTESVLLGIAGSAVGVVAAISIIPTLSRLMNVPVSVDVSPDPSTYLFVAVATVAVGILAGLAPARYGYSGDITAALKLDQSSAPMPLPRARLRSLLIGGQAAISALLLVLAALLTRSLVDNVFVDVGYDLDHLVTVRVNNTAAPGLSTQYDGYWAPLREDVLGLPGVAGAAFASMPPFDLGTARQRLNGVMVSRNETSPQYFETIGLRTVRGRTYSADEMRSAAPVVVISASLARAFWGTDDPLGDRMDRVWGPVTEADEGRRAGVLRKVRDAVIIGIVEDATTNLDRKNAPTIYLPLSDYVVPRLVVRATASPAALVGPLRDTTQRFDPRQRPRPTLPLDGLRREIETPRTLAMLSVAVGGIALLLATIGLFGVTAFVVEQRTHEMSVRRALGASSRQLVELMLRDNLRPVAIGLTIGLLMALAGGRMIQAVLYGTSSRDPLALVAATIVLLVVTALAVLIPARKAGQVDPVHLLKQG